MKGNYKLKRDKTKNEKELQQKKQADNMKIKALLRVARSRV